MGRINYYEFPETVPAHTRYLNGAGLLVSHCHLEKPSCLGCKEADHWSECTHLICDVAEFEIQGIKVSAAKKLLKEYGGKAYTLHCERDGGVFEVTDITLQGNNSKFKYNHHL